MQSPQKRGIQVKFVLFGIFLIMLGVGLFPAIRAFISLSRWFEVRREFTVPGGEHYGMTWNASQAGDKYYGYIIIEGGDDDIRFFITDSTGETIYDAGLVKGRYDFSFGATTRGVHWLHFDNRFSTASKTILWIGEIPLLHEPLWVEQFWTAGLIILGIVWALFGFFGLPRVARATTSSLVGNTFVRSPKSLQNRVHYSFRVLQCRFS